MSTAPAKLDLPEGWKHEFLVGSGKSLLCLERPGSGGGFVTIDFARRIFAGGMGRPYDHLKASTQVYEGRCWKQNIIKDAVAWLDSVMQ